jgi:hypothetical protein
VGATQGAQHVELDEVPERERQRGFLGGRYQRLEEPDLVVLPSALPRTRTFAVRAVFAMRTPIGCLLTF